MSKFLIDTGIDLEIKNNKGEFAYQMALNNKMYDVANYIIKKSE